MEVRHSSRDRQTTSTFFPGLGLGVIPSGAGAWVTDEMFLTAARRLARAITEADLKPGALVPSLREIRDV
jgi:malic enzyme